MNGKVLLFILITGISQAVWAASLTSARTDYSVQAEVGNPDPEAGGERFGTNSLTEQELHKYRLFGLLLIISVSGLFAIIFIITYFRVRRYRRSKLKIGQKAEPTEYIDAWSQHRLRDDQR
ncbi:MAG: hypothetical protein JW860_09700 [Sedimentisphaerales bacterium]|nr:hypothetical protein [Sedimentisphaerales bacterium]